MGDVLIYLPATSPMWDFNPGHSDAGWTEDKSGRKICKKGSRCAAEIVNANFNQINFLWSSPHGVGVSVGVDGQLSAGDGGASGAQVPVAQGRHTARIQVDGGQSQSGDFELVGTTLKTAVEYTSQPSNSTLDDASSAITYSGWTSTTPSAAPVDAIRTGKFFSDTISYTSTAGASASFSYTGPLLYVFGCTGPGFGSFQISIDGATCGVYNATSARNTYGTLLYVGQASDGEHRVEVKNMVDGKLLALDYFVAISSASGGEKWDTAPVKPVPTTGPSPTATHSIPGGLAPAPSSVFPNGAGSATNEGESNNSAMIGGILGTLGGILLLFLLWRYRQYRKAGGEGSFFVAICGPSKKPAQTAGTAKNDFKLWPMVRFRPKYAT